MPTLIDLPGRQGRVVDAYTAAAIDFGRRAIAKLTADALARHLRTGDANSLIMSWRLFNAEEIHRLVQVYAAVVATAELLGRSDVRQQWAATLAAHGELPAPLTEAVSNRLNRMFVAWLAPIREDARDAVQPMPPEAALEYFRGLTPTLGVDVQRFGDDLRRRVFTMAVATDTTILQRVQGVIADRMQTGVGFSTAAADIQDVLRAAGVDRGGAYAEAVFRTNVMDSYNQARTQELRDPDVAAAFPVWEYVNPSDSRSRPEHAARNGKYYPSSATFNEVRGTEAKDTINCRCSFAAVSKYRWNKLKAAGARIADGYPDVPSMDELAAAAGATTSTQQRQQIQPQPPLFEPQSAARAEIRALTGESEPATPQPIIVRRIQPAERSPAVGAGATVEPWQLPLDEWHKRFGADRSFAESSAIHAAAVDAAMQAGKPVRWSAFYYHPELTRKYRVGVSGGYADPAPAPAPSSPAPEPIIVARRQAASTPLSEPSPEPAASPVPTATEPSPLAAIQSIADRFRELDYQEITAAVQAALSSVRAADAVAIAQRLGIADATGRKDAIAKIASRIRDRKESWDRVAQIGGAPLPRQVTPPGPAPFANVNTQRADSERVELAFVGDSVVVRPYFPPGSQPIQIAKDAKFLGWTWAELRAMGEGYFVLREKR